MIKAITAFTEEIDEVEAAVGEIMAQIEAAGGLLTHSAGLMSFYAEFAETGVVAAVCERLGFPVIGSTTLRTAVPGMHGGLMLGLTVLTSDDVTFSAAMTSALSGVDLAAATTETYNRALDALGGMTSGIFVTAPLMIHAGDQYADALNDASGGIPVFGTLTCDHTAQYTESLALCNGKTMPDAMAILLLGGAVTPRFFLASIEKGKIWQHSAIVTKSEGNVLMEVNNIPITQFLETVGLAKNGSIAESINTFPFVLDYNDGTPGIMRATLSVTPEGYCVCGGLVPMGTTLSVATFGRTDVLSTSGEMLDSILNCAEGSVCLMLSCVGRNFALGVDTEAEMALVEERLSGKLPYLFSYSGGELCPVRSENGEQKNCFHNNTLIACLL